VGNRRLIKRLDVTVVTLKRRIRGDGLTHTVYVLIFPSTVTPAANLMLELQPSIFVLITRRLPHPLSAYFSDSVLCLYLILHQTFQYQGPVQQNRAVTALTQPHR
jgi:hypothetical protein